MTSNLVCTRRDFIRVTAALVASAFYSSSAVAQTESFGKIPERNTLQSGDFIWPKKPGDFVPYNAGAPNDFELEQKRWYAERTEFIQKIRENPYSTSDARQLATNLEAMDFHEFLSIYQADESFGIPREFGGGAMILYVGHVGIVSIEQGNISVIEALWGKGVVRTPYDQWLADRSGSWVWHGRVANQPADARTGIATAAAKYIGKPYNFWNFDLSDTSGFYCSKLCWLSAQDALKFALDKKAEPKRNFWFSPKQLLRCQSVEKLFSPGSYTL